MLLDCKGLRLNPTKVAVNKKTVRFGRPSPSYLDEKCNDNDNGLQDLINT